MTANLGCGICIDKYKVIAFNIDSLDQADTILFAESHRSEECKKLNGDSMSSMAKNQILSVFLEGVRSMLELKFSDKKKLKRDLYIDASVPDENVTFYGCDKIDDELYQAERKKGSLTQHLIQLNDVIEQTNTVLVETENAQKVILPAYPTIDYNLFLGLSDSDAASVLKNQKKIEDLTHLLVSLEQESDQISSELSQATIQLEALVIRHHPVRTKAMAETLQKIAQLRLEGTFSSKAAFNVGKAHLVTLEKDKDKKECDLSPLYQELQHHKAAILIPKIIAIS